VEATDEDGCAASASVTVSVTTDTIFTAEAITICEGGTALIFGNETSQAGLYSQTYNLLEGCDSTHTIELAVLPGMSDTTFQSICQGDTIEFLGINYTESGVYCTGNSSSPCDSTCLNLVVLDTPSVAISVLPLADTTISPGDTALLMIDSLPFESIVWADSAGVLLEECSGQFSCWVVPEASTFYTVSVTGENGCTGTALQRINVRLECEPGEAQVPSAFSPNRDDTNDFFDIVAPNAERVSWMKVWDRWGEKVYEGIGPWDGRYKDKDALPDVYIYLIRVGCPDGIEKEEKILKGDVTLLR
jgi:gliding motility-associated-like protein